MSDISGSLSSRYRVSDLRYRTSHSISRTSISYAHSISTFFTFDIVYRYRRCLISKVMNRVIDIEISCFQYRANILRSRILISYTISKVTLTFDFECHVIHIGFHIVYDIAPSQCHSQRSGSSLCAGCITPASKSLSATCPRFLHPLFAQLFSLFHRDLTRKGLSIPPHSHVDFEQPASSHAVLS